MNTAAQSAPLKNEALKNEPALVSYFECQIPETNLRTRINLDVITRLAVDVMEGYKKVPKRGLEVGGLLLGRVQQDLTIVEEFEALDSEHQRGPSFLLSDKDKRLLADAVARRNAEGGLRVVGLYRSQTRDGLLPADEDVALMSEHCSGACSVLLLVKPQIGRPGTAALFAGGDGLKGKPAQFPFHHGELVSAGHMVVEAPGVVQQPEPMKSETRRAEHLPRLRVAKLMEGLTQQLERAQQSEPRAVVVPVRRRGPGFLIAWGLAIVISGGAAGYVTARWWRKPVTVAAVQPGKSMALSVTWVSGSLHLRWDRNAPLMRSANHGVLWIADKGEQRRLDLTAQELREGSIAYWPSSSDVSFKLEVFPASDSTGVSESVRAVSVPLPAASEQAPPKPESRAREGWAPVQARPSPAAMQVSLRSDRQPFARVDMEVLKQSVLRRLAGKEPLTIAPKPLHPVIPAASAALRRRVKDEVAVDVRIELDAAGKVKRATLVSKRSDAPRELADLAVNASRHWTFTPARIGERRVSSAVVLHYHFGNPVLAEARLP